MQVLLTKLDNHDQQPPHLLPTPVGLASYHERVLFCNVCNYYIIYDTKIFTILIEVKSKLITHGWLDFSHDELSAMPISNNSKQ